MTTREKQSLVGDVKRFVSKYYYYCKWREMNKEDFNKNVDRETFILAKERFYTVLCVASSLLPHKELQRVKNEAIARGEEIAVEQFYAPLNPLA